jgi:hypothetical protein
MHALNAVADAAELVEAALGDDDVAGLELLPQAAASTATAAIAAAAGTVPLTDTSSLTDQSVVTRTDRRPIRTPHAGWGRNTRTSRPGMPAG